jgi:CDGSH-type Zn-finger protein
METPKKAGSRPIEVELKQDNIYSWCSCGLSFKQPFCDGEHMGTKLKPKVFKAEKSGPQHLCMCKQTNNVPFCDGTHNNKK